MLSDNNCLVFMTFLLIVRYGKTRRPDTLLLTNAYSVKSVDSMVEQKWCCKWLNQPPPLTIGAVSELMYCLSKFDPQPRGLDVAAYLLEVLSVPVAALSQALPRMLRRLAPFNAPPPASQTVEREPFAMKHIQRLLCCRPKQDEDASGDRKRATENFNGIKAENRSSPAELGIVKDSSSPSPQTAAESQVHTTGNSVATSGITSAPTAPVTSASPTGNITPGEPSNTGSYIAMDRKEQGKNDSKSRGIEIAVSATELILDTAKDVLEFCGVPAAVFAVGSVVKVITLMKVRICVYRVSRW